MMEIGRSVKEDWIKEKSTMAIKQDWEQPQIKDLKLAISKQYTFMASNTIFISLDIPEILKRLR